MMIKSHINSLLILITLGVCLGACEEPNLFTKVHPVIIMEGINVSSDGAEFVAEVINLGTQKIISHGFVWAVEIDPSLNNTYISDTTALALGRYSQYILSGLSKGSVYVVRPYVITDQNTIYGTSMSFQSEGSNAPEILDFEPKSGNTGDLVTVTGKYFGYSRRSVSVRFGNVSASRILYSSDSLIRVNVPNLKASGPVELKVVTPSGEDIAKDKFDYQ